MPPAPPGDTRDSAPDLVGRRRELSWLRSRLDLATRGYGHLVLVEGDAGIGKTRLVEEFLVGARSAGVAVVRGRSYEHLDLSYLPLRETLFAPLARELASRPGRERDVRLLERMGALGDLDLDDLPEGEAGDREHTRQLLAVTRLVIEAAQARPTTVFLDDVDWADRATLDLVRHLLFRMADEPVTLLLVGTTRSDPDARAAGSLSRLRSDPRVATLSLHPLTELEATEFARQLEPAGNIEHARRLAAAGNGNPLLIEALAQESRRGESPDPLLRDGGPFGASHHPVTDAIATRLLTLGATARVAARAAAFLQPGCTRDLLAAATDLDDDALDGALADAIAHGVLVDDPEHPRFTHPLFVHALIEEMPGPARREFHAKIAALLAARRDAGEAIETGALAHHLIEAGDRADPAVVAEVARRAGDEAMARTAWNEAARCYEAAITASPLAAPADLAALHRSAGLAHRGDMEMGPAVKHFAHAIDLLGPDADPVPLAELHVWRMRCGIGSQNVLGEARDRGPLEALVERIVDREPELAAEGMVELAQSYWVDWEMAHATDLARRAMALAESVGSHRAFARAVTTLCVPQWAEYDLLGSVETLQAGIAHARAARDDSVLVGGALFRAPLVLTWLGRLAEAEALALEGLAVADRTHYPLEEGLPLAALTQIAVARGRFAEAEQFAHQALLVQRLSGYHWAAGLYLPALATGLLAESRYDGAREALDTWSETGDEMARAAIQLYQRLIATRERGQAVQGGRLPRAPATPMIGGDAWAAACVEIARWEGPTADVASARDLLRAVEERGGVLTSSFVALVPRVLGVAQSLTDEIDEAESTLRRAIAVADRIGAEAEGAKARVDLAGVLARQGDRREALELVDHTLDVLDRLGMTADADVARTLAGAGSMRRGSAATGSGNVTNATAVIFFSDVVDSTRLTEELGVVGYRMRARQVESLVTSAIVAHSGTVVSGISLGDGFIGLFSSVRAAVDAAQQCAREVGETGLHLHLALHHGDILLDGDRIYGGPVNYASRVCGLTGPDEILVSAALRAQAGDLDLEFVDRGQHVLKGIEGPQPLFALVG